MANHIRSILRWCVECLAIIIHFIAARKRETEKVDDDYPEAGSGLVEYDRCGSWVCSGNPEEIGFNVKDTRFENHEQHIETT